MFKRTPLFAIKGKPYYLTRETNVDAKLFMFASGLITAIMVDWVAELLGLTFKGFLVATLLAISAVALSHIVCEFTFEPSIEDFDAEAARIVKDLSHENTPES